MFIRPTVSSEPLHLPTKAHWKQKDPTKPFSNLINRGSKMWVTSKHVCTDDLALKSPGRQILNVCLDLVMFQGA